MHGYKILLCMIHHLPCCLTDTAPSYDKNRQIELWPYEQCLTTPTLHGCMFKGSASMFHHRFQLGVVCSWQAALEANSNLRNRVQRPQRRGWTQVRKCHRRNSEAVTLTAALMFMLSGLSSRLSPGCHSQEVTAAYVSYPSNSMPHSRRMEADVLSFSNN